MKREKVSHTFDRITKVTSGLVWSVGALTITLVFLIVVMPKQVGALLSYAGLRPDVQVVSPEEQVASPVYYPAEQILDATMRPTLRRHYRDQMSARRQHQEVFSTEVPPFLYAIFYNPRTDSASLSLLCALDCQCALKRGTINLSVENFNPSDLGTAIHSSYLEHVYVDGYPATPAFQSTRSIAPEGDTGEPTTIAGNTR